MKKTVLFLFALMMSLSFSFATQLPLSLGNGALGAGNSSWDYSTKTITFPSTWAMCGWWFGSAGVDYSAYTQVVVDFVPVSYTVKLVVQYADGTKSGDNTYINAGASQMVVDLDPTESNAIQQIYIQNGDIGTLTLVDAYFTDGQGNTPPATVDLIPLFNSKQSGTNGSFDPQSNTITTTSAWGSAGCYFGSPGQDFSAYNEVVVNFEPVDFNVQLVIQYSDGTVDNSAMVAGDAGSVSALLMGGKQVKQIYIQTSVAGSVTLTSAYVDMNAVNVTGISLDKSTASVNVGAVAYLTPTIAPDGATDQKVTWHSSDPSIVTVTNDGSLVNAGSSTITGISPGTATISVTTEDGAQTASCTVTVIAPVTGVSLDQTTLSLYSGDTGQLTATVSPSNASNKNVSWSTSDPNVATVDANGLVTAEGTGSATITVTTEDGSFTATSIVTVSAAPNPVTGVSLNQTTADMFIHTSLQLTATVAPANATDQNITWSSSNPAVATVDANGLVIATGEGTAEITVTTEDGSFTATCNVTVSLEAEAGVSLSPTTATLVVNETIQLTPTFEPADATNQNVTWSSSDPAVATVDANGLVTAVGEGTATITVTTEDGGFTATSAITVTAEPISVAGVNLNLTTTSLVVDSTLQLAITFDPANATNQNVTWSSSDTTVATVDANGLITAVGEGTATITVTTEDGGFTSSCTVTVTSQTGIPNLSANTSAYISGNQLYIQSTTAETVQVYSVNGVLLYNFQKPESKANYSINQSKGTILIAKGSSGWIKKLIVK